MNATCLKRIQTRYAAGIDREIARWLNQFDLAAEFSGMMQYQLGYVNDSLAREPSTTAKRFRPALCLLACETVGGDPRDALTAAAAIELLHNFSLVHDDIEDRDVARRHRPTVWKVWGEPQAINTGDGMFALAGRCILAASSDPDVTLALAGAFQETSLFLTDGQYLDMSFEGRQDVSPAEYLQMIAMKTATLVGFSLWSGALLGGAGDDTRHALRRFGLELGKAFQIWDDVMGIWGAPAVTGKEPATDLRNRKKTLPVLLALEHGDADQQEAVRRFLRRDADDINSVLEALQRAGARQLSEQTIQAHLRAALAALDEAMIDSARREDLQDVAQELAGQRPLTS